MLKRLVEMMDFITVRDEDSLELLMDLGVKNRRILLAADAALNARSSPGERVDSIVRDLGISPAKEILAININRYLNTWASPPTQPLTREAFLGIYADALNEAMSRIDAQLLFVCTQHHDIDISEDLMKRISAPSRKALLDNRRYNPYEVKGVLGRASLLLGMRLHAMILASSALCPIIGLAYQPKVDHYFRSLGLRDYSLSFGDFNASSLSKHLRRGWAERQALKEHVVKRVPALQQEAEKAAAIIASIDRGENTDRFFHHQDSSPPSFDSDKVG
jgi:polysaccharide pyruvyl transferase WcaK-like protein